jgi:hypothetical protein
VERVFRNALASDAAMPFNICAFGDSVCHQSGPDWHFQEKSIHPKSKELASCLASSRFTFFYFLILLTF